MSDPIEDGSSAEALVAQMRAAELKALNEASQGIATMLNRMWMGMPDIPETYRGELILSYILSQRGGTPNE